MLFKEFAQFLKDIETVDSRNEMTVKIAEFLNNLSVDEVKPVMYLMQGRLAPKFVPVEFNFSEKLVLRAIENTFQVNTKELYSKLGDAGSLIEQVLQEKQKSNDKSLNILEIYKELEILSALSGKGSQEGKINKYLEIVNSLDSLSAKYVTRVIVGNLRLGFSDKTILDSFSWFIKGDKSLRKDIDIAFGARADLGELGEIILKNKDKGNIKE